MDLCFHDRHEATDKESEGGDARLQVQVQNTKLGISTFWSLEKFQSNLAAMREFEQVAQIKYVHLIISCKAAVKLLH